MHTTTTTSSCDTTASTTSTTEAVSTSAAPIAVKKKIAPAPQVKKAEAAPKKYTAAPASVGGGGNHWAMTYTPYGGDGHGQTWCKKADQIAQEIGEIAGKGFATIRLYSTDDCDQLAAVHSACQQHGLKLIIGVFFKDAGACEGDMESQLKVITGHFGGAYDAVELITIGNECISSGTCQAGQLAGLISSAKETLSSAGYHGPVSSALIVSDWQEHGAGLCDVVDVVAAQIHPFFSDRTIAPSDAGSYFEEQYELAAGVCSGKPVLCSETGWPHTGGSYKGQQAGKPQQAAAIESLRGNKYVGKTTFFANGDDLWKHNQEEYEMYFGCLDQF